jgi:tRNA pseudouridine32 synthase/23S rRNA pseudouridine746 synthase
MSDVLFQNEHFVVVNKPADALCVPPRFRDKDSRRVIGTELEKELGKKIYPVHRLDYGVSGIVLYALSDKAHRAANAWFENRGVKKTYQAITENHNPEPPPKERLEWRSKLLRGKKRAYEHAMGKMSITYARIEMSDNNFYFWLLEPVTGRAHQLRYELHKHGYPILGDELYGAKLQFREGIALRAIRLEFLHPEALSEWKLPKIIDCPPLNL